MGNEPFLLHDLLASSASSAPGRTALIFLDREMSYSEVDEASDRVAGFLIRSGIGIGDRVGLFVPKSPEAVVAVFGILKAGAAYVPIDVQLPPSRALFIIENCGIRVLFTSFEHFRRLSSDDSSGGLKGVRAVFADRKTRRGVKPPAGVVWDDILGQPAREHISVGMADVDPAYILYTSGSTGMPKGVVISHANAMAFVSMAYRHFAVTTDDRLASHAPLHFDLSVFDLYVAMKAAATVVLFPEYLSAFPVRLVEYMHEKKVSVWNSAASVLVRLAERGKMGRFPFDGLRLVHFSGDVMPLKYLKMLRELMPKAEFYNIYGQTEANSSMGYRVGRLPESPGGQIPIGRPFPNFEVFALDEHGEAVSAPGIEGELYIKSSTVALGYWQDPTLTKEKFVQDPRQPGSQVRVYKTGDIVRSGEDGNFYFVGRKDHMVKSRGYRIELQEVERVIASHPLVGHVAVIALPDESIGNKLIAFVSPAEGGRLDSNDLAAYCANSLPKYMVPEVFELQGALPMTSSGKIDRTSLARQASAKYGR